MKVAEAKLICPDFNPVRNAEGKTVCQRILPGDMCQLPSHFLCDLVVAVKKPPISISVTRVQSWLGCERAWAFRYAYRVEPPVAAPWKALGKAFAVCRAKIDAGQPWQIPPDVTEVADRWRLEVVLDAYAKLPRMAARNEVKVESVLEKGPPDLVLLGYVDGVSADGKRIYEWKYAQNPDDYTRLKVTVQASAYFSALPEAQELVVCVARKPKLEPFKATPPEKRRLKKDGTPYADVRDHDETETEFKERLRLSLGATGSFFTFKTFLRTEFDLEGERQRMLRVHRRSTEAALWGIFDPNYDSCDRCDFESVCSAHVRGPGCSAPDCMSPGICTKVKLTQAKKEVRK